MEDSIWAIPIPLPRFNQFISFNLAHFYLKVYIKSSSTWGKRSKWTWKIWLSFWESSQNQTGTLIDTSHLHLLLRSEEIRFVLEFCIWLRLRCQHGQETEWELTETKFSQNWYWGSVSENVGVGVTTERTYEQLLISQYF